MKIGALKCQAPKGDNPSLDSHPQNNLINGKRIALYIATVEEGHTIKHFFAANATNIPIQTDRAGRLLSRQACLTLAAVTS